METNFVRGHLREPRITLRRPEDNQQTDGPSEFGGAGSVLFRTLKEWPDAFRAVVAALAGQQPQQQ